MKQQIDSALSAGTDWALGTDNKAIGEALNETNNTTIQPSSQQPPTPLPVIAGNIPEALRALNQWVCWRYIWAKTRWTKPPYQPNGRMADKTNPQHYSEFAEVWAAYKEGGFDGIGFVLTADDPFVAIDIDDCLNGNSITDEARDIIKAVDSYTEKSPSSEGIRIFVKGTIPRNIKKGIEIYDHDSYVTVTGQRWQS